MDDRARDRGAASRVVGSPDYLIATVILTGIIQVLLGVLGVAKPMRFIPRAR